MLTSVIIPSSEVTTIIEHGVYKASELEDILGKRGLHALREAGLLCAIGNRYLGSDALDKFRAAHENRSCNRRVSGKKGERQTDDTQTTNIEAMEAHIQGMEQRNERMAKSSRSRGVRGQVNRVAARNIAVG